MPISLSLSLNVKTTPVSPNSWNSQSHSPLSRAATESPVVTLLYPLYASVVAIESPSKLDDEQWLAYWIIYSFLTLGEMLLQPVLEWIPIWHDVKLLLAAWLVLPQFMGVAYLYERFVRDHIRKYVREKEHQRVHYHPPENNQQQKQNKKSPTGAKTKKFVDFIIK